VSTTKTAVEKVATVIVPVRDQDAMIDFYVEKLGLTKRVDVPFGDGYRWVEVAPGDAETTIALAPPPEGMELEPQQTGISFYSSDVKAYHAQLKADGVDVDEEVQERGEPVPPMFWFRDPEGNSLMVVG